MACEKIKKRKRLSDKAVVLMEECVFQIAAVPDLSITTIFKPSSGAKQKSVFRVSRSNMCCACKPWKAMLKPSSLFREGALHTAEVSFEDDDPPALRILLDIAHLNFNQIPKRLDFVTLLKISVLCDKYDTVRLVTPWIRKWTESLKEQVYAPGHEEWLFIAWTFGDVNTYTLLTHDLVLGSRASYDGTLLGKTGLPIGQYMPPEAIGRLCRKAIHT